MSSASVVGAVGGAGSPVVGFAGSRSLPSSWSPVVARVVRAHVTAGARVFVGDAAGADLLVRSACPPSALRVFAVSAAARRRLGHGAFAARSVALVRAVAAAPSPAFCLFVPAPCPAGVIPATSWRSGRPASGSWSAGALAAGLGVPLFVFVAPCAPPAAPALPCWPGGSWQTVSAGPFAGSFRWSTDARQDRLF